MSIETLYGKGNQDQIAPKWILSLFEGWYDPCPLNPEGMREKDGLNDAPDSVDRIYCHPPYSDSEEWVDWCIRQAKRGKLVALLLKHDHSTKWYSKLHNADAVALLINKRLAFGGRIESHTPFISTIFILEPKQFSDLDKNRLGLMGVTK